MMERNSFRVVSALAVAAFLAAMILAWMKAPGEMALVTAAMLISYWVRMV